MNKYVTEYEVEVSLAGTQGPRGNDSISLILGVLPVDHGGTGLDTLPEREVDLSLEGPTPILSDGPIGIKGALPISHGGTGATTLAAAIANLNITPIEFVDMAPGDNPSVVYFVRNYNA